MSTQTRNKNPNMQAGTKKWGRDELCSLWVVGTRLPLWANRLSVMSKSEITWKSIEKWVKNSLQHLELFMWIHLCFYYIWISLNLLVTVKCDLLVFVRHWRDLNFFTPIIVSPGGDRHRLASWHGWFPPLCGVPSSPRSL